MKRIFRRNQIIITTLAIMIAAAGYLNYSAKKEVAGAEVYEAGMMEISDEDILAENQAVNGEDGDGLVDIASLDKEEVSGAEQEAGEERRGRGLALRGPPLYDTPFVPPCAGRPPCLQGGPRSGEREDGPAAGRRRQQRILRWQ